MSGLCIDVYVRLRRPDEAIVTAFLDAYAPHWMQPNAWLGADDLERLRAGLRGDPLPDEANLYLTDTRQPLRPGLDWVIVSFDSSDGGVVLGLSLPDGERAYQDADALLADLQGLTNCPDGFWGGEHPPPKSESEWQAAVAANSRHDGQGSEQG